MQPVFDFCQVPVIKPRGDCSYSSRICLNVGKLGFSTLAARLSALTFSPALILPIMMRAASRASLRDVLGYFPIATRRILPSGPRARTENDNSSDLLTLS